MSLFPILEAARSLRDAAGRSSRYDKNEQQFVSCVMENLYDSNSQLFQDVWVLFETGFKRNGYFVEFGACDGIKHSNTLLLENIFGWKGILAEPAHTWINRIIENRNCHIDRRCVYKTSGDKVIFNQVEGEGSDLSTIERFSGNDGHALTRTRGERYEVETISLVDLLKTYNAPDEIDYISLDTEGSELEILSNFDFNRYNVKMLTVKHAFTPQRDEIYKFLSSKGYRRKFSKLSDWDDWYIR